MPVIVDKHIDKEILEKLSTLNIKYYKSTPIDSLNAPVNTHPDMQIHFVNHRTAFVAPSVYEYYKMLLPESISIYKGFKDPGNTYPEDCSYNITRLGKKVIGHWKYVDIFIKEYYTSHGFELIDVKQGYTKCNLCVIDNNSVITEDAGLYKTLSAHGIDTLKIEVGEVRLDPFKHGFIGGASGKISPRYICFCGNIYNTSYFNKISVFIEKRQHNIIQLSQTKLTDYGSILSFDG